MGIKQDIIGSRTAENKKNPFLLVEFNVHHLVKDVLECVASFKPMDLFFYIKEA